MVDVQRLREDLPGLAAFLSQLSIGSAMRGSLPILQRLVDAMPELLAIAEAYAAGPSARMTVRQVASMSLPESLIGQTVRLVRVVEDGNG